MKIRLTGQDSLRTLFAELQKVSLDGKTEVVIQDAKHKRTLAQNALYWGAWLPALKLQTGMTVEELHDQFRTTLMVKVYLECQQNRVQEQWVEQYVGLRELVKGVPRDVAAVAMKRCRATCSTTWATVEQYSDFLSRVEAYCRDHDLLLPLTQDYGLAMGRAA